MPALTGVQLVEAILDAVEQSGWSGLLISGVERQPRKFVLSSEGVSLVLWAYVWTLTFGGRPSLENEYRIQMTSVKSPLSANPDGPTVLVGYEPNLKMFGGFDVRLHRSFTAGSPSVQIDIRALQRALQNGLAFHRKGNNEIAVAARPDQFVAYACNAEDLHIYGKESKVFDLLDRASALERIATSEISGLTEKRKKVVETITRFSRSGNFREQVLNAYGHRCAVTRAQLRLVEASHILPVSAPGSIDHVTNGVALSPTYHRAFDRGLIYLDDTLNMKLNRSKAGSLATLGLEGGLEAFARSLGKIHLPSDRHQWPSPRFIAGANKFRRIGTQ